MRRGAIFSLVTGLLVIDAAALLLLPPFARVGAIPTAAVAWIVVGFVAYAYGVWAGVGSAAAVAVFQIILLPAGDVERLVLHPSLFAFVPMPVIQSIAAVAVGRWRRVAQRIAAQSKVLEDFTVQALHDQVTGLPNRAWLQDRLDAELLAAAQNGTPLSVVAINLENLKEVNDVLGHGWGDALLREASGRLRTRVREGDALARMSDDEFVVLLPGVGSADATVFAERLAHALTLPYDVLAQTLMCGASIGIAARTEASDSQSLLREADVALYAAKRRRDRVAVFSLADDQRALNRLAVASSLHEAISKNRLVLHYQPQVRVKDGQIVGVEALVRWEDPELGLLRPDAFIPIAEELGMMGQLTDWVLRTAVRQLKDWQRRGIELRMSINLSAQNLRDDHLSDAVDRLLALYEVSPSSLCLEITETTVATEAGRAAELLGRLSALGVRIAIDDFGTGYSALSHLKQFPVDELKIDKSFVMGIVEDSEYAAIVAATIDLAHQLNIAVVVEGIEKRDTWEVIASLGADYAQGYAISPALPAAAFERWLRGWRANQPSALEAMPRNRERNAARFQAHAGNYGVQNSA
jgi:diguanylate cyclase (GGDEF)-like protein